MTAGPATRVFTNNLVAELGEDARRTAATLAVGEPDHDFYAGVQAAVSSALHPVLGTIREEHPDWLTRHHAAFQAGYLEAQELLGLAMTMPEPPARLSLPVYHAP